MARRTTDYKSIVIVCEGSDTEFRYFRDIKKYVENKEPERFSDIKIVPACNEIIKTKNPNRKNRGRLKDSENQKPHYWCLYEHSQEEYDQYSAQPTRYVREAKLYMEEGYTEAWAVYDKDVHTDHPHAMEYAKSASVNIAFSSYSFEQWLLCHFERNNKAFNHSDCEDENKRSLMCGTHSHQNDCFGEICIAGRIREKKYIEDYSKEKQGIFDEYTLPNINKAMLNAAWLRHLSSQVIYERNPYTDVDYLVSYLLGDVVNPYFWCSLDHPVTINNITFSLYKTEDGFKIRYTGNTPFLLRPQKIKKMDANYNLKGSVVQSHIILESGKECSFSCLQEPFVFLEYDVSTKIIFSLE